jgi:hypothetical protein
MSEPGLPREPAYGPTGAGSVVLEMGAQIGALVLYTPASMAGREIEISARRAGARRTHASVRARPGGRATRYAALYQGLPAGDYTIWHDAETPAATVTITGGQLSACEWPGPAPGGRAAAQALAVK